jgi:hypothetical protein
MYDVEDIIKNIESIYGSNTSFQVLKDFERVLDELDIYVYKNWNKGELAKGPKIERHWVTCEFMWPKSEMPDPMGGKRLIDYDCKVRYKRSKMIEPRKIRKPDDIRPGTKKGKLDTVPIWIVEIQMPKTLIADIYQGYLDQQAEAPKEDIAIASQTEPADELAGGDLGGDMGADAGGDMGADAGGEMTL